MLWNVSITVPSLQQIQDFQYHQEDLEDPEKQTQKQFTYKQF